MQASLQEHAHGLVFLLVNITISHWGSSSSFFSVLFSEFIKMPKIGLSISMFQGLVLVYMTVIMVAVVR